MAVKLRLTRMGAKKRPSYRIVASDSRQKRDGEYLELVGTYNPIADETKINEEVALKWLRTDEENTILIQVLVDESDMGRVIGKGGKLANAIRTLVQASSYTKDNKKVRINIDSF